MPIGAAKFGLLKNGGTTVEWTLVDSLDTWIADNYTGGSQTVDFNITPQENDIVIALVGNDREVASPPVTSGTLAGINSTGYTEIYNPGAPSNQVGASLAWKRMGASPDTSISIRQDQSLTSGLIINIWRGAETTGSPLSGTLQSASGASGAPNPPSHTPADNNALVFAVGILDDVNITSCTAPSGYTNLNWRTAGGASESTSSIMMSSKVLETAAAENPAAYSTDVGDAWRGVTFSLKPNS